jgi:hypothetical protein
MNRVVNELTADEVDRGTGVKIGDFGTGSRTYRTYDRVPAGDKKPPLPLSAKIIAFLIGLIGSSLVLYYYEKELFLITGTKEEAKTAFSYGTEPRAKQENNMRLIHAQSTPNYPPKQEGSPPDDSHFGMMPHDENVIELRRNTEYCQWMEIPHHNRKKVGKDPDYCSKTSYEESCNGESCGHASEGSPTP